MRNFLLTGRLVQGGLTLQDQDNDDGSPKLDSDGNRVKQCYIGLAIQKGLPTTDAFLAELAAEANTAFPHLVGADGRIAHPQFAWKLIDGDGVDSQGKPFSTRPGFAGHWIVKMATMFLPTCYQTGRYDMSGVIQNPGEFIKRGYYIRVAGNMAGNGVKPTDTRKKPGIFITPQMVEFVAYGEVIQSGPDAADVFGKAGAAPLPPGAMASPVGGAPVPTGAPPAPTGAPPVPPAAAAPPVPAAAPPVPPAAAAPPAPPVPAGPQMTAKAQGVSYEAMIAQGWTDALLVEHGYMA